MTPGFSPASVTNETYTNYGVLSTLQMELGGTILGSQYDHINFQGGAL